MKKICVYLFLLALACQKEDVQLPSFDVEQTLRNCFENAISDSTQIHQHLVGKWQLVGSGCGHCAEWIAPTATVDLHLVGTGVMHYSDGSVDNLEHHFSWSLVRQVFGDSTAFYLEARPFHHALNLTTFCQKYMYGDGRPVDLVMFLYEKQAI